LINQWVDRGCTINSGSISLTGGTKVPLVFEEYNNSGGGCEKLQWSGPSIAQQTIPFSQFTIPAVGGPGGRGSSQGNNAGLQGASGVTGAGAFAGNAGSGGG